MPSRCMDEGVDFCTSFHINTAKSKAFSEFSFPSTRQDFCDMESYRCDFRDNNIRSYRLSSSGPEMKSILLSSTKVSSKRKSAVDSEVECKRKSPTPLLKSVGLSEFAELQIISQQENANTRLREELPITFYSETSEADKRLLNDPVDEEGNTALHHQIIERDHQAAERIMKKASGFDDLNVTNKHKETPLHLAANYGLEGLVRKLMCAGAMVLMQDCNGNTPLHIACEGGHFEAARHLLTQIHYKETQGNKYQIPFSAIPQDLTLTNKDGKTCFDLAKASQQQELIDFISEYVDNDDDNFYSPQDK